MGAAVTLLSYRDPNVVFIDDPKDVSPLLKGFAKSLFRKMEWPTLKIFCNTYGITHGDTCVVFKRFLQYEEVYLLQFKVRTKDVRNHFNMHSRLEKEIADSLVPLMFMKEFPGLEPPAPEGDVVTFARFIITSYLFCAAQIPDLIHDFITMLRQKLTLGIHARLHTYSIDQLMKLMVEDLQPSAAAVILVRSLDGLDQNDELDVLTVVKLGVKYPILFYVLERFRKHIKRVVFGDKFWAARTYLKARISELDGNASYYGEKFKDERTALIETSRAIIADVVTSAKKKTTYRLNERPVSEVMFLDEEGLQRLKDLFGYERSRQLVVDSEVGIDCESRFVEGAFGAAGPVPRPERGVRVFPGGTPKEILELDSEEEEGEEGEGGGAGDAAEEDEGRHDLADERLEDGGDAAGSARASSPSRRSRAAPSVASSHEHDQEEEQASPDRDAPESHSSAEGLEAGEERASSPLGRSGTLLARKIETIVDVQLGREFRYDPHTGKSAWVLSVLDQDGDVLLESCG